MKIILYTTEHCPVCRMIKDLLTTKNIEFETVDDMEIMLEKGIKSAPMLEVNGEIMNAKNAMNWIKSL